MKRIAIVLAVAACGGGSSGGDAAAGGDGAGATDGAVAVDARTYGDFPGPNNTGVPAGTTLTAYDGPCVIDVDGTVIDGKTITCDLEIHAANVVVRNSKVNGLVFLDADRPEASGWSLLLEDSEVDGGPVQRAAVSDGNMIVRRANVYGGETAVHCSENATSCRVEDSWLHGQYMPDDVDWHLGGFQSNGGTGVELVHNTVVCDHAVNAVGGGCTGDINLIPDFAVVTHALIDHNFLGANADGSYCTYGGEKSTSPFPHADHVVYTNNVFERGTNGLCGAFGPVTGFDVNGDGNVWQDNTWEDDGTAVTPEL